MTTITLTAGQVKAIPLTNLEPDPGQPRKTHDEECLGQLAYSLKTAGQKQAAVVRPNGAADKYILVMGERRYRASKLAKLKTLDCTLEKLNTLEEGDEDWSRMVSQMIENMERKALKYKKNKLHIVEKISFQYPAALQELIAGWPRGLLKSRLHCPNCRSFVAVSRPQDTGTYTNLLFSGVTAVDL